MKIVLHFFTTVSIVAILVGACVGRSAYAQPDSTERSEGSTLIDLGSRRELFVDQHFIDKLDNIRLHMHEALQLPSGGDTSYAGMAWHDGLLWISYYSSHEGKANIYLAKVKCEGRSDETND